MITQENINLFITQYFHEITNEDPSVELEIEMYRYWFHLGELNDEYITIDLSYYKYSKYSNKVRRNQVLTFKTDNIINKLRFDKISKIKNKIKEKI